MHLRTPAQRLQLFEISTADTGRTREPDPTHNELKHTTTRKTATRERTPDKPHVHTHTHTSRTENDAHQQTTPPRITATLTQPPQRAELENPRAPNFPTMSRPPYRLPLSGPHIRPTPRVTRGAVLKRSLATICSSPLEPARNTSRKPDGALITRRSCAVAAAATAAG